MIDINLSRQSNNGELTHDQIIHFVGGVKRVIQGVKYIWENEMTHMIDYLGVEYIINKQNVLFIERITRGGHENDPANGRRGTEGNGERAADNPNKQRTKGRSKPRKS